MRFLFVVVFNCLGVFCLYAQKNVLSVGFYNVENLYDTIDQPDYKDEGFTPAGSFQWNTARYNQKLRNTAEVISTMVNGSSPDLIGLCNVENSGVLKAMLSQKALKKSKYAFVHADSPEEHGLDVAFAYKSKMFKLLGSRTYAVNLTNNNYRNPYILLVHGLVTKSPDTAFFLVSHFPPGADEEPERVEAGIILKRIVDSLQLAHPDAPVTLMGDFTDQPSDFCMTVALGAKQDSAQLVYNGTLNLMAPLQSAGSYSYYRGKFLMSDQLLVSKAMITNACSLQYIRGSAGVYMPDNLKDDSKKMPLPTYRGLKYTGGFSDHFPVYARFMVNTGKKKK